MNTDSAIDIALTAFIQQRQLSAAYREDCERWFVPLSDDIARRAHDHAGLTVVGIHGAQGTGKSTLGAVLQLLLAQRFDLRSAVLSLDDLYLTQSQRQSLAQTVHPLLQTRGVPGTHDLSLGLRTLAHLREATPGDTVPLPRFDKARDDRSPVDDWPRASAPVDVLLLEGWCLSVPAQTTAALATPVNNLERTEDADGRWRLFVNEQLKRAYPPLFEQVDTLIMLRAPSFDCIYEWRRLQESQLRERAPSGDRVMSDAQLRRFIQHFERLTRHALDSVPAIADTVFELDSAHRVTQRRDRAHD